MVISEIRRGLIMYTLNPCFAIGMDVYYPRLVNMFISDYALSVRTSIWFFKVDKPYQSGLVF